MSPRLISAHLGLTRPRSPKSWHEVPEALLLTSIVRLFASSTILAFRRRKLKCHTSTLLRKTFRARMNIDTARAYLAVLSTDTSVVPHDQAAVRQSPHQACSTLCHAMLFAAGQSWHA
mmetsp:Transcript_24888/g.41253  ORF Transcript_24888/g.41253 Transcript_24888/m.41253 type:complete len:118 (+) Transcript_24888:969-1322(+)